MSHKKMYYSEDEYHYPAAEDKQTLCGKTAEIIFYPSQDQVFYWRLGGLICEVCKDADMVAGMRDSGQPELF